jgi:short-subunit dehydrogenase
MFSLLLTLLLSPPQCRSKSRLAESVRGKTILITGASYGIGEATALLLASAGAEVLLVARTAEKLTQLVAQIERAGGRATAYPADLYQLSTLPSLLVRIQAEHPKIDGVICNAGKSIRRRVTESFGRTDLERSIALNFSSPAAMLLALLPQMIAQGGGQIINVSTVAARLQGVPRWGTYQGTKGGFDLWLRSVAVELRSQKIGVCSVYLPLVRTRMSTATPLFDRVPALTSEDAARVIARAFVRRSDRLAPWWLFWCELLALFFARPIDRFLGFLDQRQA